MEWCENNSIPASVEIVYKVCFYRCISLTAMTFESNSKLPGIDESPFADSGLGPIQVPALFEVVCTACFFGCASLTSITFDSGSKLHRIEESPFRDSGLIAIHIPASVEVVCKSWFYECSSLTSVDLLHSKPLRPCRNCGFPDFYDVK
jgi:hypothetical protein